jgi:hypothetical protein
MLEQNESRRVYLPTAHAHCQRAELEALRIDIRTCAVSIFYVHLPRLPVIPGGLTTVQFDPRSEDHAFEMTVSREIYISALLIVPPFLTSDRRGDGRVDQLDGWRRQ